MRTKSFCGPDRCAEESTPAMLTVAESPAANENMEFHDGEWESRHDGCVQRGVQKPDCESVITNRFICHEIEYKTVNREKEVNETRQSVCSQRFGDISSMARRNSRNLSSTSTPDDDSRSSDPTYNEKLTEICSSPPKNQDNFMEIELLNYNPERKNVPTTDIIVPSVTTDSLKESLKMVTGNNSNSESRIITENSNYQISPSYVLNNLQPRLSIPQIFPVEPTSPLSRGSSSSVSPPHCVLTSNSRGFDTLRSLENRPVRPSLNTGSNSGKQVGVAPVRLPPTLQDTIVTYLVRRLGVAVWNWREDDVRSIAAFVASYRSVVPAHIRRLMLECVQQEGRVWHTVTLRLLQLLLAEDCSSAVRVQQVRVFFRDQFLSCLTPLSRLTVLRVEDPTWQAKPQQEALLCAALPRLQQLQVLSLHYLATDAVVAAAVDYCHCLQVLDVFFSSAVTHRAAYWLLGRRDVGLRAPSSQCRLNRRKKWYTCAMSWFRRARFNRRNSKRDTRRGRLDGRHSSKSLEQLLSRPGSTQAPNSLVLDDAVPADNNAFIPAKLSLLPHLKVLDLRGTSVPGATIMEIMEVMPEVKVLAIRVGSD